MRYRAETDRINDARGFPFARCLFRRVLHTASSARAAIREIFSGQICSSSFPVHQSDLEKAVDVTKIQEHSGLDHEKRITLVF